MGHKIVIQRSIGDVRAKGRTKSRIAKSPARLDRASGSGLGGAAPAGENNSDSVGGVVRAPEVLSGWVLVVRVRRNLKATTLRPNADEAYLKNSSAESPKTKTKWLLRIFIGRLNQAGTLGVGGKTRGLLERANANATRPIDRRYVDQPLLLSQTSSHRCLLHKPIEFRESSSESLL